MKAVKIITLAVITLIGLSSCSDKQKALSFVTKEVMPEKEIEKSLIWTLSMDYERVMRETFDYYFQINKETYGRTDYRSAYITISDEFRHKYPYFPYKEDWTRKSDVYLTTIYDSSKERMIEIFDSGIDLITLTASPFTWEQQCNRLASLTVEKSTQQVYVDWYKDGIISVNPENYLESYDAYWPNGRCDLSKTCQLIGHDKVSELNATYREMYEYDWTVMNESEQKELIDDYAKWIIVKARDAVKQFNYKLVDKSCTTTGEKCYEVRYLLEPHLEIVFSVRKVGKTFVLENSYIDGSIAQT